MTSRLRRSERLAFWRSVAGEDLLLPRSVLDAVKATPAPARDISQPPPPRPAEPPAAEPVPPEPVPIERFATEPVVTEPVVTEALAAAPFPTEPEPIWTETVVTEPTLPDFVDGPSPEAPPPNLEELARRARDCTACVLHEQRKQAVFADGSPDARIMFVGEGPGADEDRQGVPFVGRAGQLLTRIIENAMGMARSSVYIANVVKCRPPGNRNPTPNEQQACGGFLTAQIRLVKPELILTLGKIATQYLLGDAQSISRMRGRVFDYDGIPVIPTWHPAYLLRNASAKKDTWEDVKLALRTLGLSDEPEPFRG